MSERAERLEAELAATRVRISRDERLARAAARGDQRAFAAIYRKYHQPLYRYCRAILRDPTDAQDALQQTMLKALRSLPGETREIALKPWLYRVAHNEAISIARARKHAVAIDSEQVELGADVEAEAARRERLRELVGDLQQLPERQRGTLVMRELSGLSFEEIGAAFELRPAAAKQAVYEARVSLQQMSEGRDMECDRVRESISAQDRRILRSRRLRAHLRVCESCRDFEAAIATRQRDVAILAPPLAAPAAMALLHGALGAVKGGAAAAGAAGGAGAGGLAGGVSGTIAAKAVAGGLAVVALAGGSAQVGGLIDIGGSGGDNSKAGAPAGESTPAEARSPGGELPAGTGLDVSGRSATHSDAGRKPGSHAGAGGKPPSHSSAGGNPPAHSSAGGNPPAHSSAGGNPPAHSSAGGNPPAQSSAGGNPPAHSSAGGNAPAHSNAGGASSSHSHSGGNAGTPVPDVVPQPASVPPPGNGNANGHK